LFKTIADFFTTKVREFEKSLAGLFASSRALHPLSTTAAFHSLNPGPGLNVIRPTNNKLRPGQLRSDADPDTIEAIVMDGSEVVTSLLRAPTPFGSAPSPGTRDISRVDKHRGSLALKSVSLPTGYLSAAPTSLHMPRDAVRPVGTH
jgi:hypothetical protein